MKFLLTALNAKYIHSNLAVYSLKSYASSYQDQVEIAEYTINNQASDILADIYRKHPDVIGFSCYIWNIKIVEYLIEELSKVLPHVDIWLGGPEVSYCPKETMERFSNLKGIMIGEGEQTFLELMEYYMGICPTLKEISGICFRKDEDIQIEYTKTRELLDISALPFAYQDLKSFENRIIYYESSRGCPFSCSYCLSSIDKSLRFRDINLVKQELKEFLIQKVPQVKFVDRTFNCNHSHAMAIWEFIKENDNRITNFHFEISADLLTEEELSVICHMRPGLIQLEIGVQSTNQATLQSISRRTSWEKLTDAVLKLNHFGNVHQHLDLIAGLPYEDYHTFRRSFNQIYALKPAQLQLGFLKLLKGTELWNGRKKYGIICQSRAPYEVLYTNWITYEEILQLKGVEEMVEVYYNSMQFVYSIQYLCSWFSTPFDCYYAISKYVQDNKGFAKADSRIDRYKMLLEFSKDYLLNLTGISKSNSADKKNTLQMHDVDDEIVDQKSSESKLQEELSILTELLVYDVYLRENIKTRPSFARSLEAEKQRIWEFYIQEEKQHHYLPNYQGYQGKQIAKMTHMEHFSWNPHTLEPVSVYMLFDYQNRSPITHEAAVLCFPDRGGIPYYEGKWQAESQRI